MCTYIQKKYTYSEREKAKTNANSYKCVLLLNFLSKLTVQRFLMLKAWFLFRNGHYTCVCRCVS